MKNPSDNENAYIIIGDDGSKAYIRIHYGKGQRTYGFAWYEPQPFSIASGGGYDKCGSILSDWLSQHDVPNANVDSSGLFGNRYGVYRVWSLNSYIHNSEVSK